MKKLIEILLQFDKKKHAWIGLAVYVLAVLISFIWFNNNVPFIIGNAATCMIGAYKEIVNDKILDKGTPEWMDFFATIWPGLLITGIKLSISAFVLIRLIN